MVSLCYKLKNVIVCWTPKVFQLLLRKGAFCGFQQLIHSWCITAAGKVIDFIRCELDTIGNRFLNKPRRCFLIHILLRNLSNLGGCSKWSQWGHLLDLCAGCPFVELLIIGVPIHLSITPFRCFPCDEEKQISRFISLPFPARLGNCPPHHKPHFRCWSP